MKLTYKGKLIFAPLSIVYGDRFVTVEAVIDTGSAGTAIDIGEIPVNLSCPGIMADMVGIGGSQQVLIQEVDSVSLDGVTVEKFPIEFGDFSANFALQAIIGGDLLKRLEVVIDYSKDELNSRSSCARA